MSNNKSNNSKTLKNMTAAAICLALCMVLPFLTGQIPTIGKALGPMHIPVLLAGFVCGPWWALAVGAVAPLLRSAIVGMPPMFPTATAMAVELAVYGLVAGLVYLKLKKNTVNVYVALIIAMIAGRLAWGVTMYILMAVTGGSFTFAAFIAGAFTNAIPGIIVHIILIPILVMALRKAKLLYDK